MRSKLHVKPKAGHGHVISVTPEQAGWTYVGFNLWKLKVGDSVAGAEAGKETCLVLVSGKGRVRADHKDLGFIGGRASPFEEGGPWSVYLPPGMAWSFRAETEVTLAICHAPGSGAIAPRVIAPEGLRRETRGRGNNIRHVTNILPEWDEAESLLVVEVITPAGNTSSYPPHKHDENNLPHESLLEETYYHRLNPAQGFAFQRVYTDDRSLDVAMAVEDGDVTLVPRGYHPCATVHGYDLYYLNVMAGPKRTWKFHNAKEHEWLMK